jgi:Sulfotransferase domain
MTQANGATKLARRAARWSAQAYARPTAGLRLLPDYLIIGAQRAGTTSLHRYLVQHPGVRTMLRTKGVHFFDTAYGRGMSWYASRFPTRLAAWWVARRHGVELRTGEASPYYLFHPQVPARVAEHLPRVKLIALLRDPVVRAYSHYQHEVARGFEPLSFEEAIEAEPDRLAGETERMLAEPLYHSFAHQHHSYLARGRYLEQLERWRARFDDRQLLVLSSERFFAEPDHTFGRVLEFLELPAFTPPGGYEKHNGYDYRRMGEAVHRRLVEHYREPNRRLYESLGDDFGWSA